MSGSVLGKRCVFIGDEPLTAQCAEIASDAGLEIVAVASVHPQVRHYAEEHGIATIRSDGDLVSELSDIEFDVLLSVANLRVLPSELIDRAEVAINFHDGPLPEFAGLNVTSWALLERRSEHAVTWHMMTGDVDRGDIVTSRSFAISDDETAFSLNARCYEAALESFPSIATALLSNAVETTPQPNVGGQLFRRRDRPRRLVDPATSTAREIETLVRALDLGHLAANSIGVPILLANSQPFIVVEATAAGDSTIDAGRIVEHDGVIRLGTTTDDLSIRLSKLDGIAVGPANARELLGVGLDPSVDSPSDQLHAEFAAFDSSAAGHESFWRRRLEAHDPSALAMDSPLAATAGDAPPARWSSTTVARDVADEDTAIAAACIWIARASGTDHATFDYTDAEGCSRTGALGSLLHHSRSHVHVDDAASLPELQRVVERERRQIRRSGPYLLDLVARSPELGVSASAAATVTVSIDECPSGINEQDSPIWLVYSTGTRHFDLHFRSDRVKIDDANQFVAQLEAVFAASIEAATVGDVEILTPQERMFQDGLNQTVVDFDRDATIDGEIWERAALSPDAPAVSTGSTTLTYGELVERSDALAQRLAREGVARGDRVGIALPREQDLLVGVLATLRLGAAYVPLDPSFPADRLQYMVGDAGLAALLARDSTAQAFGHDDLPTLDPADTVIESAMGNTSVAPAGVHDADALAYVIYTSGSTGRPKGVMLEHRNVLNFFAAMDRVIDHDPPGVWLAVTSLSFDISVLELLWTLTRGFHVVLKADSGVRGVGPDTARSPESRPARTSDVSMSLFYFAAAETGDSETYRLLLDGARFADIHGFEAIWTPERHFHAFGGAYPNPSVISAAIAATTDRVAIRAGSVVLPLHSPVRVAEEWSIVDNLSNGRVGISFAPGWQPNDFVLNPARYGRARDELPGLIDTVHRLWRGETVDLPGHDGAPVAVSTLPRPVQAELPTWLTSAGSPASFERAGRLGFNVLTHLLGQTTDELTENIDRYRAARAEAGHDGDGRVTLMLHTYLDRDIETAKNTAREPMKAYLGTAVGLIKNMASSFPTFAGSGKDADEAFEALTADELDQLLDVAAERYLDSSGLFGTPEDAAATIVELHRLGVDEVACLVDFGVDVERVLASFPALARTKEIVDSRTETPSVDLSPDEPAETVASLVARHGVTHLQCTPSLATMLAADPEDRHALSAIGHLLLGGEALPVALARELRQLLGGRFTNMYGPTETTIWSLVHEITRVDRTSVPIGRPVANTSIHVLDANGHGVPTGVFGELHIGGDGVARGYHDRPELTAERFVDRAGIGRVYATGDIVRLDPAGHIEFGGRTDNQLKIRGHRIELGEIEAILDAHPTITQSVVVARGDASEPQLVAFVVTRDGEQLDESEVRTYASRELPAVMVPSLIVALPALPLTPNAKIDRNALPDETADVAPVSAEPADERERTIALAWSDALGRRIGRDDNFFDAGGHSLLAVRVFKALAEQIDAPLSLTDLFRFPTVRALAAHVQDTGIAPDEQRRSSAGSARGERRRQALARRGG